MRAFRAPSRPAETAQKDRNRQPTKAISRNVQDAPSTAPQHISKMAKRTNSNLASSQEHTSNLTQNSIGVSRRASVTSQAGPNRNENSTPIIHPRSNVLSSPQYSHPHSVAPASSLSTIGAPRSNVLRRKASTIEQYTASKRAEASNVDSRNVRLLPEDKNKANDLDHTVMSVVPPTPEDGRTAALHRVDSKAPDSVQTLHLDLSTSRGFTPPVTSYAQSVTPSTRYTDSPFSHVPTPSSASSYSSYIVAPSHSAPIRQRQPTPVQSPPPASRHTIDEKESARLGLPPVRESSTSSSSTIKSSEPRSALSKKKASQTTLTKSVTRKPVPATSQTSSKSKPPQKQPPAKASVGIPPELAHLNVDLAPTSTDRSPPRRPSRDGTSALTDVKIGSPVVQSDLPRLYTSYHKRTPSQETPTSAPSPSLKSRFGFSSKQSSPRVDSAISPPPIARALTRAPSSDQLPTNQQRVIRKDSPAIGPAPSKSPRFGFWSRKPKADDIKPIEKPSRPPSKGPAAGTGHEGYGRFMRGRSSSGSSSAGLRSPSTTSTTSSQAKRKSSRNSSMASTDGLEMDDFLRERLAPVILRGSASTVSNATSTSDVPALSKTSSLDSISRPQLLPSAMDSTAGRSPSKRSPQNPAQSNTSDTDLTARLISQKKKQNAGHTLQQAAVPNQSSRNNPRDRAVPQALPNREGRVASNEDIHGDGPGKGPRKWSFFQRTQASPREKGKAKAPSVPDLSNHLVHQRSVPHYAMLDPTTIGLEEVEQIVRDNETSPEDSASETNASVRSVPYGLSSLPKAESSSDSHFHARPHLPRITIRNDSADSSKVMYAGSTVPHQAPHMVDIRRSPDPWSEQKAMAIDLKPVPSLSSSAVHTPDTPQEGFDSPDLENANSPRQPRLSPIGRIPKVVSKRDRERKLSDSSFSRPFVRTQPKPSVKPPGSLYNQIRELASPTESNSQPLSSTSTTSNGGSTEKRSSFNAGNLRSEPNGRTSVDAFGKSEFFASPRRNDSDVSYSSSSGNASVLAILAAQPPQEEDIWDEYDDLMDEVTLGEGSFSPLPSLGAPYQYSDTFWASPVSQEWYQQSAAMDLARSQTVPATLSVPQQIARFMQPSFSPMTTPQVLSEFFENYGRRSTSTMNGGESIRSSMLKPLPLEPRAWTQDKVAETTRSMLPRSNRSSLPRSNRSSLPSARGSTVSSKRTSTHSRSASLPENPGRHSQSSLTPSGRVNRDTQLLDIVEVDGDEETATANLRYAALTTSKWLSFGRVLFSPAHHEMRPADDPRILIIDGLGSDWSYYVATTYPTAVVYNLGPPAPPGFTDWPSVLNERPPSNHRHISHSSISAAFPFPKGFFTAVVFRFPLATSDAAYQACIFECKRVLRPGGFLEVAALDLDLMNMGNLARKELRGLKTRLQSRDRDIGLRNLSDMLVRLIGRRGFEDLQRCIVGVPVAGQIPKSQDISSVGSAEGVRSKQGDDRQSRQVNLADLFDDARAQQRLSGTSKSNPHEKTTSDEDDTEDNTIKMVAKVGRWWYSTCYERPHLLRTDDSIWNATALLRECEKQGTSFRLLICYAQKPAQTRRRTVSV